MDSSGLSYVYLSAAVAMTCFVLAAIFAVKTSRHTESNEASRQNSIIHLLLSGESLTKTGMAYRTATFIAMMFAIINVVGTVVLFLATQMLH